MSRWKPKLVVRRGRSGGIASPVTTTGYVFFGLIGVLMSAGFLLVTVTRDPWACLALLLTWWPIRDAVAWFAASEQEREDFRAQVARLEGAGVPPSPSTLVVEEGRPWRAAFFLIFGAGALIVGWNFHPAFLVLGMFFLAVGVLNALDVLRAPRKP